MTGPSLAHEPMLLRGGIGAAIAVWTATVVAMMLPGAVPAVRHVAVNSLRRRRGRAVATFALAYVVVWACFGVVMLTAARLAPSVDAARASVVVLAVAAAWQLTAHKRRALNDCHRPLPLPPRGRRATIGVVRFATFNGLACVRSCWAMMLAMAVSGSMALSMLALTGLVTLEKWAQRPRRATRLAAVVLAAGAAATAALS